MDVFLLFRN